MLPGSLCRVTVFVPESYVDRMRADGQKSLLNDLKRRVERLGFTETHLVMQDPTDNRLSTLIARRRPAPLLERDEIVQLLRVEPVEEPPHGTEKADPRTHPWDPGLAVAEVRMIARAMREEYNPRHLWGLAESLVPSFPIAASELRARKRMVETSKPPGRALSRQPSAVSPDQIRKLRETVDRRAVNIPPALVDEEIRRVAFMTAVGDEPEEPFRPEILALARTLLREVADGVFVVDKTALLTACPPRGTEGDVAPPAIQLALAVSKPEMSRVRTAGRVRERKEEIGAKPASAAAYVGSLETRSAMMRAQKAIETHRWLRWHERAAATAR